MNNNILRDGEPCSHPGCQLHITKPCDGCGRIGARNKEPYEKPTIQSKPAYFCYDCLNLDPTDCDPEEIGHYCDLFKQALHDFPNRPETCLMKFGYISLIETNTLNKEEIKQKRFNEYLNFFNEQMEKDITWIETNFKIRDSTNS